MLLSNENFIASPLNYTGGKYKLLNQIFPYFPEQIDKFVDLFCGGCNVGINADSKKIIYNDASKKLISLFKTLKKLNEKEAFETVFRFIREYDLSMVCEHGYSFYGCESASGVGEYNKPKFLKLREDFNNRKDYDDDYYLMLYVMIVYSFNNQIRFNSDGDFNLPVGKRDFNKKMQAKLSEFMKALHRQDCEFFCKDFRMFDTSILTSDDFVYVDPPYLITCATYNEKNGWGDGDEMDLLFFLDTLSDKKIKFALSNVLRSKGKENKILINWLNKNHERYNVNMLNYGYSNSNYHLKDRTSQSEEVLITNYK